MFSGNFVFILIFNSIIMKTKLLYLFVLITTISWSQGSTDYVKFYSFDGGSLVNVANPDTYDMTVMGSNNYTTTTDRDGDVNGALDITAAEFNTGAFTGNPEEFTYSFWIKTTTQDNAFRTIFRHRDNNSSNSGGGVRAHLRNGAVNASFAVSSPVGATFVTANSTSVADGNWHNISVTLHVEMNNSSQKSWEIKIYVDGILNDTNVQTLNVSQNPQLFTSSRDLIFTDASNDSSEAPYIGELDDIKIWTRALSDAEVYDLATISSLPNDAVRNYNFSNGSLENTGTMSGGDLITTGTAYASVTDFDGNINSALDMNGDVFDGGVTPITSQNSSYSFWIKVEPSSNGTARVLTHYETGLGSVEVYIQNNNLFARMEDSAGYSKVFSTPNINDGLWHHIALTIEQVTANNINGYEGSFYKDGVLIATDVTNGINSQTGGNNWITFFTNPVFSLSDTLANAVFYQDAIDEVKVFDRALTVAEVTALATNNTNPPLPQVFVDASATGNNDGTSWADAYTNLSSALSTNPSTGAPVEFWIADGTYTLTSNNSTFTVSQNQKLYGGFNGTETQLSQRNPDVNETILSGDVNGNDTGTLDFNLPAYQDNAFQVVTLSGNDVLLDGLTIKGGNARGNNKFGSAILIQTPVKVASFNKLLIEDNRVNNAGVVYFGHASTQSGAFNYTFTNCIFRNNLGRFATVFYASNPRGASAKTTFLNSVFYDNVVANVPNEANGINSLFWFRTDIATNQVAEIINCTIASNDFNASSNAASIISASRINGNCTARLYNSVLWDNKTSNGAEHITLGTFSTQTVATRVVQNSIAPSFSSGIAQNSSTADPILAVFPDKYKYRIANTSSPAIDFGNNTYLPSSIILDLLGNNRYVNTVVDAGAYEFDTSLSISEVSLKDITFNVYPNPTNSIINIKTNHIISKIDVYNLLGTKVLSSNKNKIDVSELQTGMYLLKIQTENNQQITKRFIKN